MIIKGLYIYPIKGIKGISVKEALVEKNGLQHDRLYMLVDSKGQFISQRKYPVLTQFIPTRAKEAWAIDYKGDQIQIKDNIYSSNQSTVEVWGAQFNANEVSKKISQWFSEKLDIPCKLMVMPNKETRIKELNKPPYKTSVSFADGYPILTLGTASLANLNQKLDVPVPADRFRANILIETSDAHAEDKWSDIKIGEDVICRNIKPCVRCQVITIDQDSGKKGMEPSKTLAGYRKFDNGICFGSNVIVIKKGKIKVNDEISLLS